MNHFFMVVHRVGRVAVVRGVRSQHMVSYEDIVVTHAFHGLSEFPNLTGVSAYLRLRENCAQLHKDTPINTPGSDSKFLIAAKEMTPHA